MTQRLLDILYTPIAAPEVPNFDRDLLDRWCMANSVRTIKGRGDGKQITPEDIYPWDIVYARNNYHWIGQFKQRFPQLADYFSSAFLLKEQDIKTVVLLPIKPFYQGATYWHSDPDEIGLRIYLENNESTGDFLLFKPTHEPYDSKKQGLDTVGIPPNGISPLLQDKIYSAKLMKPTQAFYVNNVRAVHTVNVSAPNLKRLAVLVITTERTANNFFKPTEELIISSAEKFKEWALWWSK